MKRFTEKVMTDISGHEVTKLPAGKKKPWQSIDGSRHGPFNTPGYGSSMANDDEKLEYYARAAGINKK